MLIPLLKSAVQLLKDKDENSTGADDEAAKILDAALDALSNYLAS
jgi:hypothetical protein